MTVEEYQSQLAPKEDLSQYAGEWVAMREGYVVAHALDPITLRDMAEVEDTDVIMPVPDAGASIQLL